MKFFQKTGVAVTITVIAVIAALVIGFLPTLQKSNTPEAVPETVQSAQDSAQQTEQSGQSASTSQTAGDESIGNQYIRDEAGLLSKSTENKIKRITTKSIAKRARTLPF